MLLFLAVPLLALVPGAALSRSAASPLAAPLVAPRHLGPQMLLGADGKPMKGGGADGPGKKLAGVGPSPPPGMTPKPPQENMADSASAVKGITKSMLEGDSPNAGVKTLQKSEIPADMGDFDPDFDPLAAPRPLYDLAAASGRDDEFLYGAVATQASADLAEWAAHMK